MYPVAADMSLMGNSLCSRYDRGNCQLVCDDIGVAYPIVNGIPNLIPADARMIKTDKPLQPDSPPV